jgi:hypothetical protein
MQQMEINKLLFLNDKASTADGYGFKIGKQYYSFNWNNSITSPYPINTDRWHQRDYLMEQHTK